jgi:hypothetical protein
MEGQQPGEQRARRIAQDVRQLHPAHARPHAGQVLLHRALDEGEGHPDHEGGRRHDRHDDRGGPAQLARSEAVEIHAQPVPQGRHPDRDPQRAEQRDPQEETQALRDEEGRPRVAQPAQHPRGERHAEPVRQQEGAEHGREQVGVVLTELPEQTYPDDLQRDDHVARKEDQHAPEAEAAERLRLRRRGPPRPGRRRSAAVARSRVRATSAATTSSPAATPSAPT